ncbi:MAG: hypothetical protein LBF89_05480 [Bacteroidales bacterium]|nr:hypothetical protein [Bacteroidales bacterium]
MFPAVALAQQDELPAYFSNPEYTVAVRNALIFQMQADSLQRSIDANTDSLSLETSQSKQDLKKAIRDDNALLVLLLKEADEWFGRANKYVAEHQKTVSYQPVTGTNGHVHDHAHDHAGHPEQENSVAETNKPASEFKILSACPYSSDNPIPINSPLPDGVVYKIQLGAYSKPVPVNAFKGLCPISGDKLPSGIVKYYVGLFLSNAEAEKALREVKNYGYKDSFLVAFYNQKNIILNRALKLEKIVNP